MNILRRNNAMCDLLSMIKALTETMESWKNGKNHEILVNSDLSDEEIARIIEDRLAYGKELVDAKKRELRKIYKGHKSPYVYEKYEDEYATTKMILPFTMSKEEQEIYIRENSSHCRCDFDCSGEVFTVWMKLFTVNGKTIVYECTALNV